MATVILKPGKDARLSNGHLWVYEGEIARIDGHAQDGDVVDVRAARGRWLGRGFLNTQSTLTVRLLTTQPEEIDETFLRRRLEQAIAYRQRVVTRATAYRVVYGEGDFLPGLIVDRYGDIVVLQTLALGMEIRKTVVVEQLADLLQPAAIFERNDPAVRRLEGLAARTGWLRGEADSLLEIREGEARLFVDVARGQKTGFFLDQRENRAAVTAYVRDAEVLDAFCYSGAFGIQAVLAGARHVAAIDVSADAVALAQRNAALNGAGDQCTFSVGNVFDELRQLSGGGPRFDVVILDPPAFARTKAALTRAIGGYKEINLRALKLIRPGGVLVTCSCSFHMTEAHLRGVVASAAADTHRALRLIESRGQARDHPVHPAMPETKYLTCLIFEVR